MIGFVQGEASSPLPARRAYRPERRAYASQSKKNLLQRSQHYTSGGKAWS